MYVSSYSQIEGLIMFTSSHERMLQLFVYYFYIICLFTGEQLYAADADLSTISVIETDGSGSQVLYQAPSATTYDFTSLCLEVEQNVILVADAIR